MWLFPIFSGFYHWFSSLAIQLSFKSHLANISRSDLKGIKWFHLTAGGVWPWCESKPSCFGGPVILESVAIFIFYGPPEPTLVGGFNPSQKYARQFESFPQIGMNIKQIFELPPPSTCLEVVMVYNLVFRWPKDLDFSMGCLGAHGWDSLPKTKSSPWKISWNTKAE